MKKVISKSLKSFMLSFGFLALVGCSINTTPTAEQDKTIGNSEKEVIEVENTKVDLPLGKYNEGVVLVKKANFNKVMLGELEYKSVEQLYKNSPWQKVELKKREKTSEAIEYLSSLNIFEKVEYDYIMGSDGEIESIDVSGNPNSNEQGYLETQGVFDGWGYQMANNMTPGGSPDVVVAVIDTGVDYNHIDLRNNIWTNSGEIPNNGIDDDNNGYVDDVRGWDCVGNDADPMDDNGHGTHVAGIIAAENNVVGTVGVAFNCKIMCLKAGNSSGFFNSSDIAEAVQYAYMNGASVINMSFGGSISAVAKEALEDAYNQCVLVAAAGNDSLCNNLAHAQLHYVGPSFPASLPYVIGVMSTNENGTEVSPFSNYDDTPYNNVEYETYACGEQVVSTWPNNKIARLSGTSMASPVVAGIAALLRSVYTDRETYSNKFIQSQIINTGTINPYNPTVKSVDYSHSFANAFDVLTKVPKPAVSLYDYYVFDDAKYSAKNNGNGIIEAGETIRLAIELLNRGGVASNVSVTIDTIKNGDPSLTDPYFTIVSDSLSLPDIGTYSIRDCEKIYDDSNLVIGTKKYFEMTIADNCPNNYLCSFNIRLAYKNGIDNTDLSTYSALDTANLAVFSGYILPTVIDEDVTYYPNKLYVVSKNVTITSGTTVTFEPGCQIQFYQDSEAYYNSQYNTLAINNYGTLLFNGSKEANIELFPSELFSNFVYYINNYSVCNLNYCDVKNLDKSGSEFITSIDNSHLYYNYDLTYNTCYWIHEGDTLYTGGYIGSKSITNSYIELIATYVVSDYMDSNYFYCRNASSHAVISPNKDSFIFKNNVVYSDGYNVKNLPFSNQVNGLITNNVFMTSFDNDIRLCGTLRVNNSNTFSNNEFYGAYKAFFDETIVGNINPDGSINMNSNGQCEDYNKLFPFVKSFELLNKDNETVKVVGSEKFTVRINFSRPMNTSCDLGVFFGTREPYSDYKITGNYVNDMQWEGEYTIKAFIENGRQYLNIKNGYALSAEGEFEKCLVKSMLSFDINTSSALSMNLQAYASSSGINLEWTQDDYDTLMGYNVYRSTSKDGNYVKLNSSVIPVGESTFVDDNAEPGVTYWYTFTVVFSDMTESAPAGKVSCTAVDTIAPSIYHTPVNQGYLNNNLVISCTASDNIGIQNVTLYYRTKGQSEWKSLTMLKQNDRYSATIFGSELSLEGLEYYIVASDGVNTINKGSAENPYLVIIKDASAISQLGDVDGDGVVTTKDALMIMQSINGDLLLTDDQFKRADLNKDGVLSSVEALRILQYINGNVATLEM